MTTMTQATRIAEAALEGYHGHTLDQIADAYYKLLTSSDVHRLILADKIEVWLADRGVTVAPAPAKPGRPAVGDQIKIAMPADLLAAIDADATAQGVSRSEWIRRACAAAL